MSDDSSQNDLSPPETPALPAEKRSRTPAAARPQTTPKKSVRKSSKSSKKELPMAEDKPKSFEEAAQETVKAAEETVRAAEATLRDKVKDVQEKARTKAKEVVEDVQEQLEDTPFDEFIEHQRKAVTEAGKALESLIPKGFREHGEAAVKEAVEGYRRLFNNIIDQVVSTIEKVKVEETAEAPDGDKKAKSK